MCFEDEAPPAPPPSKVAPPAPSIGELTKQASDAQLEAMPRFLSANQQYLPQYAQLFQDIQNQQAPQSAQRQVDLQRRFAPQLIDLALAQIKQSDPTGFAAREALGQKVLGDLSLGGALSPEEQRLAQQDVRAGQLARGAGTGGADAIDEARFLGAQRFGREQQRMSNVGGFLAGKNIAQYGIPVSIDAASPNVSGFAAQAPTAQSLTGLGMQGAQLDSSNINAANNLAWQQYQYKTENTTNPFMAGLGAIMPIAGAAVGGVFGGPMGAQVGAGIGSAVGQGINTMGGPAGSRQAGGGGGGGFGSGLTGLTSFASSPSSSPASSGSNPFMTPGYEWTAPQGLTTLTY